MSFDDILNQYADENEQANKSALAASAIISHNTNPDKQGENNRKAKKLGMPAAFATPATGPVNMEDMYSLIDDFHKLKGTTAKHMSNPDFAKVAKDDHENLSGFEMILGGEEGKRGKAIGETLLNVVTGLTSWIPAGLSMTAPVTISKEGIKLRSPSEMAKTARDIQSALTYEPESEEGKALSAIAAYPFTKLAELGTQSQETWYQWADEAEAKGNKKTAELYRAMGLASGIGGEALPFLLPLSKDVVSGHIKNVVDYAKKSKLRDRDPEAFRTFTEDASEGHPPVQMPIKKVDELLASKRMKPGEFFDDPTHYYETKFEGEGGKVDIPVSDLAANAEHVTPENVKDMSLEGVPSENEAEAMKEAAKQAKESSTEGAEGGEITRTDVLSSGEIVQSGAFKEAESLFKKPDAEEEATTTDQLKALNEDMGQTGEVDLSGVVDYLKKSKEETGYTGDLQGDYYKLRNKAEIDRILTKRLLENAKGAPADYEAIYNWIENPTEPITPVQMKIYKSEIEPIRAEREKLFAKLRNEGIPIEGSEGYTPRFVADRGGVFDRLVQGMRSSNAGAGILRKTAQSFKHRVMKAIEDEQGNRRIVSIKDGRVTAFEDGKTQDIGGLKSKANEDLGDKKYFIDKDKKQWKIAEATTKEIEANTKLKYHKNALLNEITTYNELKKVDRAIEYLENLKTSPEFTKAAIKLGTQNIPDGYKTTVLPQLRGYAFPDRMAETFDTFYKHVSQGLMEPSNMYGAINTFLRNAIFFNPLIHIPNITVHAVVNRGITPWLNPMAYPRFISSGARAIRAVLTMNDDYVQALEKGTSLLYSGVENRNLYELMLKKMGKELEGNKPLLETLSKALGYANPVKLVKRIYKFSSEATWAVNDIATLQAVYEDMGRGMTMDKAITETAKHIPNYRIPPRIMNSTTVSKLMKPETGVTMFGAYHYGALKSYGEMAKSLIGKVPMGERAAALDKIAMLGLVTYVIYPQLDKLAQAITGDKVAFRRAGASTFPFKTEQLIKGTIDFPEWLQTILTPSIGMTVGMGAYMGRDPRTGKRLSPKEMALNAVAPISQATRMARGEREPREFAEGLVGISKFYSDAERLVKKYIGQQTPQGDEEGADQRKLRRKIIDARRKDADLTDEQQEFYNKMTPAQKKTIDKESSMTPMQAAFSHLQDPTLEKSVRVWAKATDDEREELRDIYQHRINTHMMRKDVTAEEAEKLNELIDKAEARK